MNYEQLKQAKDNKEYPKEIKARNIYTYKPDIYKYIGKMNLTLPHRTVETALYNDEIGNTISLETLLLSLKQEEGKNKWNKKQETKQK